MSQQHVGRPLTERQQFWREHLRRCEAQGLTLKAYAQAHSLSVAAMYAARRDIARKLAGNHPTQAAQSVTLVPVIAHSVGASRPPAMQVHFPGGVRAEVSPDAASEVSAALLRAVLAAPQ